MFFSKVKKCNDDRVFQAGLDTVTEFRGMSVGVTAFACCFVKDTLVISFGYDGFHAQTSDRRSRSGPGNR